jgi:serine/threonine-protein kinase RsbT
VASLQIRNRQEMPIETEDDVVLVRRAVRALAKTQGFDAFASAALTTATSELTRNVWVHARRGRAVIEDVSDGDRIGVRVTFQDQGPGIADLDRAMAGGFSTARSMGLGLSGSKRLVDQFAIETTVGVGTRVEILKWKGL